MVHLIDLPRLGILTPPKVVCLTVAGGSNSRVSTRETKEAAFLTTSLGAANIAQRISWAADRRTTREEDL